MELKERDKNWHCLTLFKTDKKRREILDEAREEMYGGGEFYIEDEFSPVDNKFARICHSNPNKLKKLMGGK